MPCLLFSFVFLCASLGVREVNAGTIFVRTSHWSQSDGDTLYVSRDSGLSFHDTELDIPRGDEEIQVSGIRQVPGCEHCILLFDKHSAPQTGKVWLYDDDAKSLQIVLDAHRTRNGKKAGFSTFDVQFQKSVGSTHNAFALVSDALKKHVDVYHSTNGGRNFTKVNSLPRAAAHDAHLLIPDSLISDSLVAVALSNGNIYVSSNSFFTYRKLSFDPFTFNLQGGFCLSANECSIYGQVCNYQKSCVGANASVMAFNATSFVGDPFTFDDPIVGEYALAPCVQEGSLFLLELPDIARPNVRLLRFNGSKFSFQSNPRNAVQLACSSAYWGVMYWSAGRHLVRAEAFGTKFSKLYSFEHDIESFVAP